jgi:hypothetical protein
MRKKQEQNKSEKEGGEQWVIKDQIKKRKGNKTLNKKAKMGGKKT